MRIYMLLISVAWIIIALVMNYLGFDEKHNSAIVITNIWIAASMLANKDK